MRAGARGTDLVAEVVGLHGAFSFPERLLQQIWLRGDFDRRALRLRDGRPLRLVRRGRWNRLAGPDFADAELEAGEGAGRETWRGAVEVHLRATDWDLHGHARDPAYDAVVLHVVLFPSMREWTSGAGGRRIPILELLPLLERDLEAYAEDAAVEGIAGRPYSQLREALAAVPAPVLREEIARHAARRWAAKVRLARLRVERRGWEAACHEAALEVLGYRPNRAPMLALAELAPLAEWRAAAGRSPEEREAWLEELMARVGAKEWVRGGVRPANQPARRLRQYAEWIRACPNWPDELAAAAVDLVDGVPPDAAGAGVAVFRRVGRLIAKRKEMATTVGGAVLGGTRFDTLVCDAWLPLLAARAAGDGAGERGEGEGAVLGRWWRAWTPGDAPAELLRLAREFEVAGTAAEPLSQGDLQGLLGWLASLAPRDGRGA